MHQEANCNNNCIINQFVFNDKEGVEEFGKFASQIMSGGENQIQFNDQNKSKLNNLYSEFANIVNDFDSCFYLSTNDLTILKSCLSKMEIFKDDFCVEISDGNIFYNNYFSLLIRIDKNQFVHEYECSPEYVKKNINNMFWYAICLFENGCKEEAYIKIDNIILNNAEDKYIIQKCLFLLEEGKIEEIKKELSRNKKNDKYGYYGLLELEILYSKKRKIKELKKLNKKYKNKPLFHIHLAKLIFDIDKRNEKEIRENLRQTLLLIQEVDLLMLLLLVDTAIYTKQGEYVENLCRTFDINSNIINGKLLNILIYKKNKTEEDICFVEKLLSKLENKDLINIDNVKAILAISNHKELEAIDYLVESLKKEKSIFVASNLLNLILKNNDSRNISKIISCIDILKESNDSSDYMLIASAYNFLGNKDLALENAYIGTVLAKTNSDYFMRFWALHTQCFNKEKKLKKVIDNCVITIKNSKNKQSIILDENICNKFNIYTFQGTKYINNAELRINVLGKEIGDKILYLGEMYEIEIIEDKYDFFLKKIFPILNNGQYFKTLKSKNDDDPLKEIKEYLIKTKKSVDKQFEMYDLETSECGGLPLFTFVNNEDKTFQNILLCLLYSNNNYKLYAGEINELKPDLNIIIDITSLVMLQQFNLLERLKEYCDNVYITQSTINTIHRTFNYCLTTKTSSLSVFVDDENKLRKQELTENDYKLILEFWRVILETSKLFHIINHESTLDKTKMEGCQIDSIDYYSKNECVLVSEDLMLKKFAYSMKRKQNSNTNFVAIAECLCSSVNEFIEIIYSLAKGKYIYCINESILLKMILHSFNDKEIQHKIIDIIDNLLSTQFLFSIYIEIIMKVIMFIFYYENIIDKDFYLTLIEKIIFYCDKYKNDQLLSILNRTKDNIVAL